MLISLILGLAAALLAPRLEPHVRAWSADLWPADRPAPPAAPDETRALTFAVALVIAAVLAHLLAYGSAFWLTFGALLGVLVPRARARWQARRAPDYGDLP